MQESCAGQLKADFLCDRRKTESENEGAGRLSKYDCIMVAGKLSKCTASRCRGLAQDKLQSHF